MTHWDTDEFIATGDSRETSTEIMEAIAFLAFSEAAAVRIWEDPTDAEILAITERATKNGLIDGSDLYWGAAGNTWYLA